MFIFTHMMSMISLTSRPTMILIQITIFCSILTFCISGVVKDKSKDEIPDIYIKRNMEQENKLIQPPNNKVSLNTNNLTLLNNKNHSSRRLQAQYVDYKEMENELEDENYFIDDDDLTTTQRFKRHWKRVLSRCLMLSTIVVFIILLFRCILHTCCSFLVPSLKSICSCFPCCKKNDAMFMKVQDLGKTLGMEINEESYAHLLEICEDEGMTAVRNIKR